MKGKKRFNFIIGNPPYQDETLGDNKGYAPPIYNKYIDEVYQLASKVELIHPARFLFNAGSTPKEWNKKMLSDEHLKVLHYESDSSKIFPSTEIKGGIAITYYDTNKKFGAIEVFTSYPQLNHISSKIKQQKDFIPLTKIVVTSYAYHFTDKLHDDYPETESLLSRGHAYDLKSNVFQKLPHIFLDIMPNDGKDYIKILGRHENNRTFKFIRREYINRVNNLDKFKVFLSRSNGSGLLGEALSSPILGEPGTGSTETFFSIGAFDASNQAENLLKYVKTKFSRVLLGILKTTQDITPEKWKYVPLQDFTSKSDIDWSKSIQEIDKQLYKKYGLDESEIEFIETHVKEME